MAFPNCRLFLLGLKKYGKGDWRNISRNFVVTRTPTQVASHAQKYFIRQLSGGKDKRRASIHDITTVNLNENQTPSPDDKRQPSPDHSTAMPQHRNSVSMPRAQFQWNQPNGGLDFNQPDGNMFISPHGIDSYGIHMHESHVGSPNMRFRMQSTHHHYPHGWDCFGFFSLSVLFSSGLFVNMLFGTWVGPLVFWAWDSRQDYILVSLAEIKILKWGNSKISKLGVFLVPVMFFGVSLELSWTEPTQYVSR